MNELALTSKIFLPNFKLTKWIKLYWFLEGNGKRGLKKNKYVLPDGCATIVFILEGSVKLKAYNNKVLTQGIHIIPPLLRSHPNLFSNDIYLIDIHLNPGIFYKLFNLPVNKLSSNEVYTFDDVSISIDESIIEKLLLLKDNKLLLLNEINEYFYKLFDSVNYLDDHLINNLCNLYKDGNLDSFYESNNLSTRQIQRRVKNITGLTPKTISRIARFYNILENANDSSKNINLKELENVNRITDQSHLIKEFKYFTGVSPSNFFNKSDDYLQFNTIKNK